MSRRVVAISVGTSALTTLALQFVPMATLSATAYGFYSIVFLVFVLASSVVGAIVSDAWNRSIMLHDARAPWSAYSSVLLTLSITFGLGAGVVALAVEPLRQAVLAGFIGTGAATFRLGARYYFAQTEAWRRVIYGDLATLLIATTGYAVVGGVSRFTVESVLWVWAAASVAGALFSALPSTPDWQRAVEWWQFHIRSIKPLLRDTVLLDLGSVWTPYLIGAVLDVRSLGIYRGVSGIAAPVRLVIAPLRPVIAAQTLAKHLSIARIGSVFALALLLAVGAAAGLTLLGASTVELGVLGELAPYATPVGLFVLGNFIGHYYSIVARSMMASRRLLIGRVIQAAVMALLPVGAAVVFGLAGAVWAVALGATVSGFVWLALLAASPRSPRRMPR